MTGSKRGRLMVWTEDWKVDWKYNRQVDRWLTERLSGCNAQPRHRQVAHTHKLHASWPRACFSTAAATGAEQALT